MFLGMLSNEQKVLFLNLAVIATKSNGMVEEGEKELLVNFAKEMNMEPIFDSDFEANDIVDKLKAISGNMERKIIVFELIGVMFSDKKYDQKEKDFLEMVASSFAIENDDLMQMVSLVNKYIDLYKQIFDVVIRA